MILEEALQLVDDLLRQVEEAREIGVTNLRKYGLFNSQVNHNMTIRQLFEAVRLIEMFDARVPCEEVITFADRVYIETITLT